MRVIDRFIRYLIKTERSILRPLVRPIRVVEPDVGPNDMVEVRSAEANKVTQAFPPNRGYPTLDESIHIRRHDRRLNNFDGLGRKQPVTENLISTSYDVLATIEELPEDATGSDSLWSQIQSQLNTRLRTVITLETFIDGKLDLRAYTIELLSDDPQCAGTCVVEGEGGAPGLGWVCRLFYSHHPFESVQTMLGLIEEDVLYLEKVTEGLKKFRSDP